MSTAGRQVEGARTRARVLAAAGQLIAAQGYSGTSISQISRASATNPASIYWAFGSKEGLFAAVMEHSAERFFDDFAVRVPDEPDIWTALERLAEAFEGGPEFLRLLLVLSLERRDGDPAIGDAARRVRARSLASLARGFARALALDEPAAVRSICEPLARYTLMLLDGVFVASQIEAETTNLRESFRLIAVGVRATADRLLAEHQVD
ncbi:MAG: TetR/AcrR family transcriptional regulator [Pseudomonadota bacterium]|nr:TetR/AcrR family transcriptional regulator [Pseudomonadota bacterium]